MSKNSQQNLFDLMSSAAASPAKTFRWLDDVLDWLASEAASGSNSYESLLSRLPAGFSSRTSLDCLVRKKDEILPVSSAGWMTWGMVSRGVCLTLSGTESPNDAVVCSLSDVLETFGVPEKYFLSAKACRGILRRAAKRGRKLPPLLEKALESVAKKSRP